MDPVIAFATTYYYGFVKLLCDAVEAGREIQIGQNVWCEADSRQARLTILIPDDLEKSSKERATDVAQQFGLREAFIRCPDRTRVALAWPDSLLLIDIPTVLDTIRHIHPPSLDETERAKVEAEALVQFRQEIARLIDSDETCRRYAAVQGWNWWPSAPVAPTNDA